MQNEDQVILDGICAAHFLFGGLIGAVLSIVLTWS